VLTFNAWWWKIHGHPFILQDQRVFNTLDIDIDIDAPPERTRQGIIDIGGQNAPITVRQRRDSGLVIDLNGCEFQWVQPLDFLLKGVGFNANVTYVKQSLTGRNPPAFTPAPLHRNPSSVLLGGIVPWTYDLTGYCETWDFQVRASYVRRDQNFTGLRPCDIVPGDRYDVATHYLDARLSLPHPLPSQGGADHPGPEPAQAGAGFAIRQEPPAFVHRQLRRPELRGGAARQLLTFPGGCRAGGHPRVGSGTRPQPTGGQTRPEENASVPSIPSRSTTAWLAVAILAAAPAWACDRPASVCGRAGASSFRLIAGGRPAPVVVDAGADATVRDAAAAFAGDLDRLGGRAGGAGAAALASTPAAGRDPVVVGVLGRSPLIDGLVAAGRLAVPGLAGQWEGYRQAVVERPFPGVARALVIVGADRRGAAFGAYDLSAKAGVSPWAWWADVPVRRRRDLWVTAGARADAPKVRYRGIFINDEDPAFGTWARNKFGGVNADAYARVFDLILRLRGNFLWPAMWGKSIAADDPRSMALADAKGVVLGTSHHEPMTRAQAEWHKNADGTGGAWDYATNAANLRAFWRGGIDRMMARAEGGGVRGPGQGYEQLVTVGMRGDGDEPMTQGTATRLLERVVADQRRIIADATGRPAERTPQVWALYKEVQDYYDGGMRVPDDVTLLFSDDNWGQIRRLPAAGAAPRAGGYGVYYHFDYVGGPRNYKWVNTNQVEKTWAQMDLAYRSGARRLWVANVGDLKPMEMPIDFFLTMAWDPEVMTPQALAAYPAAWGRAAFGEALGAEAGALASDYSRLAARRKPELVDAGSFALGPVAPDALDGGEWGRMVAEWDALEARVARTRGKLAADQRDAYFELVEHPVLAVANLYRLYYAVAWNRRLAEAGDARADVFAARAEAAFARDRELSRTYHRLNGGKWDGMMLQTKFGYTSWRDPPKDVMPAVTRLGGRAVPVRFRTAPAGPATWAAAEAGAYARAVDGAGLRWQPIARLGRTAGAVAALPQGRAPTTAADGVRLEYELMLPSAGEATARLYMVPALDTRGGQGIRVGVSVDDGPVRTLNMNLKVDAPNWTAAVEDNAYPLEARLGPLAAGRHVLKLWRIDDNALVQKLVLYTGVLPASYLGPEPAP